MPGQSAAQFRCPRCGYCENQLNRTLLQRKANWPWHIKGRRELKAYMESLGHEIREWLLALFVDRDMNLLAVHTVARGELSSCRVNVRQIFWIGHSLSAKGFILVHNHPSGDPRPSLNDIRVTRRLRQVSEALELPLLDHLVIAGSDMMSVGEF